MAVINLTEGEQKLLNAVIDEMKEIPEVDFEVVAQKVGIKYAKNARQSFKKVWAKMKSGKGAAASNGDDAEEGDDAESPKKPAAKKSVSPKRAPAAKKGVAKAVGPKNASEGDPKAARAPPKTKKQKKEEAASAEAAEHKDNEDEDMEEDNEDGKSYTPKAPGATPEPFRVIASIEPAGSDGVSADAEEARASGEAKAATPDPIEAAYAEARANYVAPVMDDMHEAYIRDMPLEAWLKWKAESGYTFDPLNV